MRRHFWPPTLWFPSTQTQVHFTTGSSGCLASVCLRRPLGYSPPFLPYFLSSVSPPTLAFAANQFAALVSRPSPSTPFLPLPPLEFLALCLFRRPRAASPRRIRRSFHLAGPEGTREEDGGVLRDWVQSQWVTERLCKRLQVCVCVCEFRVSSLVRW